MCFADEVLHACGYLYLLLVTGSISGSNQGPIKVDSYNHDTGEISKEPFYGIDMFHCSTLLRFGSLYSLDVLNEKCSDGDPFAAQLVPTKSLGFFCCGSRNGVTPQGTATAGFRRAVASMARAPH